MTDKARRKELKESYRETPPDAGVYKIVNTKTNRVLLGSTTNLASLRNKLEFGRSQKMPGVLDHRLRKDAATYGIDAFTLEIVETLDITPEMTPAQIAADLKTLEQLWREQLDPKLLY